MLHLPKDRESVMLEEMIEVIRSLQDLTGKAENLK
jgi:hypothetical protein